MGDSAKDLQRTSRFGMAPELGAILLGGLAVTQIVAMPLLVPIIAAAFQVDAAAAGLIGLANLLGTAAGSLFVTVFLPKLRPRKTAIYAALFACLAQIGVGAVPNFTGAVLLEALAGAGAGVLLALSAAIVGETKNSERGFGFILALQAVAAVFVLFVLPEVSSEESLMPAALFLTALQLLLLPAGFLLADKYNRPVSESATTVAGKIPSTVWLYAAAFFAFSIAVGVIWVFSGILGGLAGIDVNKIGHALAIGNIAAIIGSLIAAATTTRFGRLFPLFSVSIILMAGVSLFSPGMTLSVFYLASNLYLFAWGGGLPYFMGAVAEDDSSGRVTSVLPVISFAGMGVGPMLVPVFPAANLFSQVLGTTLVAGILAITVSLIARILQRKHMGRT